MKHDRDLVRFWNWLPAFRAIAETEHLPTAADGMNLTAPALSRTLRLLEEALERQLFDREGRRLHLNTDGTVLLTAVRRAMQLIHEGVEAVRGAQFTGPIHISVPGPFAPHFVLPALARVTDEHPEVVPHVRSVPASKVNGMLKQGELDLAVLDDAIPDDGVSIVPITSLTHDLYIAPGEKPAGSNWSLDELPPFAAPVPDEQGVTHDTWPIDHPRRISLRVTHMQVALEAVRSGQCVAVLPDVVARASGLVGLGIEDIPDTTLYAVHRPTRAIPGRIEATLETILALTDSHGQAQR